MLTSKKSANFAARLLIATFVLGGCLVASAEPASAETYVDVRVGPPVARVEVVPVRPSPHHVWVRGYWGWDGYHHAWVPGRYVVPRRGYTYAEPRWEPAARGHWHYHRGGWHHR